MKDWKYNEDKKKEYAGKIIGYIIAYLLKLSKMTSNEMAEKVGSEFGELISGIEFSDKNNESLNALWNKALDQTWDSMKKMKVYDTQQGIVKYKFDYPSEFWQPLEQNLFRTAESLGDFLSIGSPYDQTSREEYASVLDKLIISYHSDSKVIDTKTISDDFSFVFLTTLEQQIEKVAPLKNHFDIIRDRMRIITIEEKVRKIGGIKEYLFLKSEISKVPLSLTDIPVPVSLIGRDRDISAIRSSLNSQSIISIHAGGGVGKTAVALRIINDIKREMTENKGDAYKTCAWITSTGDAKTDFLKLNIPGVSAYKTEEEKMCAIRSFLQENKTFIVLDNMDIPPTDEEVDFLNTCAGLTKILITTRSTISEFESYELETLDPNSCLVLFYRHFHKRKVGADLTLDHARNMRDSSFATSIINMACYNSLFIELIANMARADHWNLKSLEKTLAKDVFEQNSRFPVQTAHSKSHLTKGSMLFQIEKLYEMSGLTNRQREIVEFISEFPAEHSIFFDVFCWAGFENDKVNNLGELEDRGWMERGKDGYLIHTMVKGSVDLQLKSRNTHFDIWKYSNLIQKLLDTNEYASISIGVRKIRERIVVPETILKNAFAYGIENATIASLCSNLANTYSLTGDYDQALEYARKALTIYDKVPEKDHFDTAKLYNNLASAYSYKGDYDNALEYFWKALDIFYNLQGKYHSDTATIYNNLAEVFSGKRDYDNALKYYLIALKIREKVSEESHHDIATTYIGLAKVYRAKNDYSNALKFYRNALEIFEEEPEKYPIDIATTYTGLAIVYECGKDYDKSKEFFEKALKISKRLLEKDHPYIATIYQDFAGFYYLLNNYSKSLEYIKKAIIIYEKAYGKNHPYTADAYEMRTALYKKLNDLKETQE